MAQQPQLEVLESGPPLQPPPAGGEIEHVPSAGVVVVMVSSEGMAPMLEVVYPEPQEGWMG